MEPVWLDHYDPGVPRSMDLPPLILPDILLEPARRYPDRPALIFRGAEISFARLADLAARFAAGLASLGLKPGDRLAIHLPNCPQFPIAFYGAAMAGLTVVPVNPLYKEDDLGLVLRDSGARAVVTLTKLYPHLRPLRGTPGLQHVIAANIKEYLPWKLRILFTLVKERKEGHAFPGGEGVIPFQSLLRRGRVEGRGPSTPDDLAVLQYTGGTTGTPKAAMLTHANLAANARQCAAWLPDIRPGQEVFSAPLPFFHIYGLTAALNLPFMMGAATVLFPQFNAREVLEGMARHRVTIGTGVPAMYVAMNHVKGLDRFDFSSVRFFLSGAAPLPLDVKERFERVSGARLLEGYGLSEASPVTHMNPIYRAKAGSIGVPLPNTEVRLVDLETGERDVAPGEEGEMLVRGPQVMKGYWQRPEDMAQALRDGWLHTGDIARMDEEGYFYIVDRKKDLVIVGGYNVYPREIEDLLFEHPKVREAAVAGVPHRVRGEVLAAYVVLKEGQEATPAELVSYLKERLPAYKVPRRLTFVDAIPKTLVGKPLRRVLREEERARGGVEAEEAEVIEDGMP